MPQLPDEVIRFRQYLKRRQCAPHTVRSYLHDWELFLRQVNKPVLEVTPQDVEAFIEAQQNRGLAATTINRRLASIRRLYVFLRQSDYPELDVPVQPALHCLKAPDPLPRGLREEEVQHFFAAIQDVRDRAIFTLMLRAGLRVQEIAALQMEELDLARQQIEIHASKNGRERMVYLSPDAHQVLQSYLGQRPPSACPEVFLVPGGRGQGQGISVRGIQKRLEHYAAQTGLALNCHRLRHTFASQLLNHGADIGTVQALLGHAHVTTTQRYARISNPKAREDYFRGMAQVLEKQAKAAHD
jgi:site-specific recombinase XerD